MNCKAESNIRIVKSLLRSHSRLLRGQKTVFKSFLDLQAVFCRITGLLNSRPLIYCKSECISVRDLYCPAFLKSPDDQETVEQLIEKTDEHFGQFVKLFNESVVSGAYQKFGRRSTMSMSGLKHNDFVCVYFPSKQAHKYGILKETPTGHKVKILIRRNRDGSGISGDQTFDCKNFSLLFRPIEPKN
jgi:hypothetical protein